MQQVVIRVSKVERDALSAAAEREHKTLFDWARGVLFAAAGLSTTTEEET